jgi:hypothetical protein
LKHRAGAIYLLIIVCWLQSGLLISQIGLFYHTGLPFLQKEMEETRGERRKGKKGTSERKRRREEDL